MTGTGFLSRWTRRKHGADAASPAASDRGVQQTGRPADDADAIDAGPAAASPVQPSDTDAKDRIRLTSLPPLESITATTDIRAFLKSGVPTDLARTALRRSWATDPAIRDFIGIAENQWDFNDPNAIPGFGPLTETDDVQALLAQALGRINQVTAQIRDLLPPPTPAPQVATASRDKPPAQIPDRDLAVATTGSEDTSGKTRSREHRRPHGSALPR
jgi:hypothetical protein